ncbi:hypothetical protein KQX54_021094 [Cotesia glomerata]|uniref:Uncharacterized protein n=1 Tax=Cotesia glomerata TaxID=32391 RepID=A0AAV7I3J4_COTGL|nr:hypothetical protein KQX54_021094 [Cotesia glomerata]
MILKGLLTLLTIFHLQNGVTSNSHEVLFEITDINSIKKFIDEHYDVSRSEKSFSVLKNLTLDEKKKAAREFYLEMEALIKNISEMIPEYERFYNSWWYEVPRDLKPYGVGRRDNFDLFAMKGRLEVLYKIIEHDVDQFFSDYMTRSQGTGNDANEINDCMHSWALYWYSANENSLNLKLNLHHGPLLVSGSIRQLFYDLTFYLSRVKKAEDNKYNYCKRTSSYHQEFYQMYKQLVIKIFQEFSVRYFSSMGQAICVSQSHMETLERMKRNLFNDLKAIMKSTKGVLHNTTWYMYQCDPTKFDKPEEVTHLELEKMVQTVIIAEKDLSTTHSCSHNCNLNLIKDTLNKTQCDEFLDCQYSTPGYQITELRNSSRRYESFTGYDGENKKQYGNPDRHFENREKPLDVSSSYNWDSQQVLFELTDINSIKKFINEHYNATRSDFSVLKNLTLEEKNKTVEDYYLKMITIVEKLSEMKSNDEYSDIYWWDNVILKELKPELVGYRDPMNVFYLNGQLKTVRKAIKYDVNLLFSPVLMSPNTENVNYCMHARALNWYSVNHYNFQSELYKSYTNILEFDNIRQVFYDLILQFSHVEEREENRYDYCKQYSSFHQGLYNVYRQVVIESFQEFSVKYFSSMGQAICDSEFYMWEKRMEENLFKSLKIIMETTKEVLRNTTYYTYPCDPLYFDNMNKERHLELEKMVQTVIIAEKDLSTTHSCSHNCNLNLIKDTINKTECDEFLDCQYSTPGYKIAESIFFNREIVADVINSLPVTMVNTKSSMATLIGIPITVNDLQMYLVHTTGVQ